MSNKGRPSARRHKLPIWAVSVNGQATNLGVPAAGAVEALEAAVADIVRQGGADLAAAPQLAVGVTRLTIVGEQQPVVQAVPEAE